MFKAFLIKIGSPYFHMLQILIPYNLLKILISNGLFCPYQPHQSLVHKKCFSVSALCSIFYASEGPHQQVETRELDDTHFTSQ